MKIFDIDLPFRPDIMGAQLPRPFYQMISEHANCSPTKFCLRIFFLDFQNSFKTMLLRRNFIFVIRSQLKIREFHYIYLKGKIIQTRLLLRSMYFFISLVKTLGPLLRSRSIKCSQNINYQNIRIPKRCSFPFVVFVFQFHMILNSPMIA